MHRAWNQRVLLAGLFLAAAGCGSSSETGTGGGNESGSGGSGGTTGDASIDSAAGSGGTAGKDAGGGGNGGSAGGAGQAGSGGSAGGSAGSGGTGGSGCVDKCSDGVSQCISAQIQSCGKQTNGCTDWNAPSDCANQKVCNGGKCPSCTDKCTYGNTQCDGTKIVKCVAQSTGCTDWAPSESCPNGEACASNACPSCVDKCTVGASQCASGQVQQCAKQSNGCADWSAPSTCSNGKVCANGACPTCTDKCTAGSKQCSNAQEQSCEVKSDGCFDWSAAAACGGGKACVGNACPTCTDKCTLSDTKCDGSKVQSCALQASGCTDWAASADCPNSGVCQNNQCANSCTLGERRCTGATLEVCNSSHQWAPQQYCAQSCDPKTLQCSTTAACTASTRRCSAQQVQTCNSTGTAWLTTETCGVACLSGLCTGTCTPTEKRCNGNNPETCNATGTAWTQAAACATFCTMGGCAEPSLVIDANANATLDGEHTYQGDVVIKNSSIVKVPSGKLIIRAKNVIIDASSQIIVTPTGDDPRGRGTNGGSTSCSAGGCTASGNLNASGGGYSATGTAITYGLSCYAGYPYYSTQYCSGQVSGGGVYGIADDEAAPGASGGSCNSNAGGKGGGLIAIYAENIEFLGTITANGQAGNVCSGGGSGGGILLRATKDLKFSGTATVTGGVGGASLSGGAGTGALGVIKFLWGDTKAISGTTTGKVFSSYMPPNDLSSSTHPRSDRWYNDAFTALELAWSRPFSQAGGYYRVLNTTYGFVPAPGTSKYQTAETFSYLPTDLVVGPNYFHTVVVGPSSDVSTIESRLRVQINSTTPAITSQSHASSTTWYADTSPYMNWTLPKEDVNTQNFYWVLDRFADTIPGKTDAKIPMDLVDPSKSKRALLNVTSNGLWFFHLITEDTMGYLTKNAGHYRMQVGTDPGKGGVSGTATDAKTGKPILGVSVSLNRGIHTVTTAANGSYAFTNNTVFAQDYEIRGRVTGYKDSVQTVTVKAGETATVNISMDPQP